MTERFIISDTHFGHANILTFKNYDGSPVRPFGSVEEMDQTMIDNWNKVVRPQDVVYHLGDVAINKKYIHLVGRCNGHKRLIMGNHDIFKLDLYTPFFEKIMAMRVFPGKCIMTHVPVHYDCLERFKLNIHGHLHNNKIAKITRDYGMISASNDDRYVNVSVECINYTPVPLESIIG